MKVLVLNTGSSSLKYQVFDMTDKSVLCSGLVEKIGTGEVGIITHKKSDEKYNIEKDLPSHKEAMAECVSLLQDEKWGVIADVSEIKGVGHRVVHGGVLSKSEIVTDDVLAEIKRAIPLAPLHNPASVLGIEIAKEMFTSATNVVVIDTAFHQTMPPQAFMYPLPYEYYEKYGVRKYGFHGTSHKYVSCKLAEILGKKPEEINAITVHLGNGSSIAAVKNGKCVETSMGLTPLDGLMMGTRCGSIDPAIIGFLAKNANMSIDEIDTMLTKKSGFLGIAGSNDLRTVEAAAEKGDEKSLLSLDMLCHRIKHYIGAYMMHLGTTPDAIVFTAGIGENSDVIRAGATKDLEHMGIKLDLEKNKERGYGDYVDLTATDGKIKVFAIRTNEELEIAEQTVSLIN